jgi:hypothetical protein
VDRSLESGAGDVGEGELIELAFIVLLPKIGGETFGGSTGLHTRTYVSGKAKIERAVVLELATSLATPRAEEVGEFVEDREGINKMGTRSGVGQQVVEDGEDLHEVLVVRELLAVSESEDQVGDVALHLETK